MNYIFVILDIHLDTCDIVYNMLIYNIFFYNNNLFIIVNTGENRNGNNFVSYERCMNRCYKRINNYN